MLFLAKCGLPGTLRRTRLKLRKLLDQNWNRHSELLRLELVSLCPDQRQGDGWIHCQRTVNSPSALLNSSQVLAATLKALLAFGAGVGFVVWCLFPSYISSVSVASWEGLPKGLPRHLGDTSSVPHL